MVTSEKEVTGPSLTSASPTRNPKRVAAGRQNRMKRKGLTPPGRKRLRQAALQNLPWRFSTGPRSTDGKAKVALNGKKRQKRPVSIRQLRTELADLRLFKRDMHAARSQIAGR